MRFSTLVKIVEKHFLNGRTLTNEEQALLALVSGTRVHDKTKEEFSEIDADSLEAMIEARKKATKQYYLDLAKKFE